MPWVDAPAEFTRTHFWVDIIGEEKTGKTTLSMSFPVLTGVVDLNLGLDGVIQKVAHRPKIQISRHVIPDLQDKEKNKEAGAAVWKSMEEDFKAAVKAKRAIVFDDGTGLYKLARVCELGGMKTTSKKGQLDFEGVNTRMRRLLVNPFHANKAHFVTTHQLKDKWKSIPDGQGGQKNVNTGILIRNGWDDIGYEAQIVLRTTKDGQGGFIATVVTNRFEPAYDGFEFRSDEGAFNLPHIVATITGTEEEKWKK